ncbi:T-kininogen 1-like [Pleurodeles waltl]|uniref:T-kininogen 1-like n=1 Tax=Pleurodeles waltl TaxID=8319 RepID=UPI00370940D5
MKWLSVLLLCSQVFSIRGDPSTIQDANCSDPNVFEAVNLALKKYNAGRKEGNQFTLNRITEAGTTVADENEQQYHVAYEIQESLCAAGDGRDWQYCQFRPIIDAATGICKAHVYVKKAQNRSSIISQQCNITNAEGPVVSTNYMCLGCHHPIPTNSQELASIIKQTVKKFNEESNQPNLFDVANVLKATRQVVAGWNYDIEYSIKETDCAKNKIPDLSPDCKMSELSGVCKAAVYVATNGMIAAIQQNCKVEVSEVVPTPVFECRGCPTSLETNSTELLEPLVHTMNKFNAESNYTFLYRVSYIHAATKQVVAGSIYEVNFEIKPTNCSKEANANLHEDCEIDKTSTPKNCKATIHVVKWLNKVETREVNCSLPNFKRGRGIAGMSPFRRVSLSKREVGHPPGHGKGHGNKHRNKCEHPHGKKDKKNKKKCKDNDDKKSSEESQEHYTQRPLTSAQLPKSTSQVVAEIPAVEITTDPPLSTSTQGAVTAGGVASIPIIPLGPDISGLLPNLFGDLLPDLPEPPVPMCPGLPWNPKPLSQPSPSPTQKPFDDMDLLLAGFDETTPETVKKQEKSPGTATDFSDDDLLSMFS